MNEYKESHLFPGGLKINHYTEASQYGEELRACKNQNDLDNLMQRWKYLCPELDIVKPIVEEVLPAIHDFDQQKVLVERAEKQDIQAMDALNALLPPTLLRLDMMAHEFGVPLGVVLMQLWNGNLITEENNFWKLV